MNDTFNKLRISNIRVTLPTEHDHPKVAAYVMFTLNNALVVHNVRIIAPSPGRLFVSMPSRLTGTGEYRDLLFPANPACREWIERILLDAYHHEVRQHATDAEWAEWWGGVIDGRMASSGGRPTEQALYEMQEAG